MEKITLTYVTREQRTSKAGKPYTSMTVKCNEYGDRFISGFGGKENAEWRVGDTVEVEIEKKPGTNKNGDPVEYLNFSVPKGSFQKGGTAADPNRVEAKIDLVLAGLRTIGADITAIKGVLGGILQKIDKDPLADEFPN